MPEPNVPATDYTALLTRLEGWLAKHRPAYLRALLPGAPVAELDAAQEAMGLFLPQGLRMLLAWHNGQKIETPSSLENSWKLMSVEQINPRKKELDAPSPGDGGWRHEWIPFLEDDSGSYLVLDTTQPEPAVRIFVTDQEGPLVACSLREWLEDFVDALDRGAYAEDPERGDLLRIQR
jgi:cell wall assembly regulator SMI1